MSLGLVVLITIVAMVAKDFVGTFLTVAEARGRANLSGILNALGTPTSVIFMAFGATRMVNGHGWVGWLGLLPVMCVDYVDTRIFTKWANRLKPEVSTKEQI